MSVRTVTYRLAKVKTLTGTDPADPTQRLALHMAVVGARLLNWPASDQPASRWRSLLATSARGRDNQPRLTSALDDLINAAIQTPRPVPGAHRC